MGNTEGITVFVALNRGARTFLFFTEKGYKREKKRENRGIFKESVGLSEDVSEREEGTYTYEC